MSSGGKSSVSRTENADAAGWVGYWRPRRSSEWIARCSGWSHETCLQWLLDHVEGGDLTVVPQGCTPAPWTSEEGEFWE
jgi:hypothetical protein